MKKAAPYQPALSRPWNSSVILGMAVATIVWKATAVSTCRRLLSSNVQTYHIKTQEENTQNQGDHDEEHLDAGRVLILS